MGSYLIFFSKMAVFDFLSCLNFAVKASDICVNFKVGQVRALEAVYLGKDVLGVLPTGYGKSLIFQLIPNLMAFKKHTSGTVAKDSVVLVICPLDSLMKNHATSLIQKGISSAVLRCGGSLQRENNSSDDSSDEGEHELLTSPETEITRETRVIFAHPEAIVSSKEGRALLQGHLFQEKVVACVVDESHCIAGWGQDFRPSFKRLAILGSLFPDVPIVALTATAPRKTQDMITEVLGLKLPVRIVDNVDRPNIFIGKYRRGPARLGIESFETILKPVADQLKNNLIKYPLTVIYLPLKWCGAAYKLFDKVLGNAQYYPQGSAEIPKNRIFAQFHAPQTDKMKTEILNQLMSPESTVRVVFATVALGMGVDIRHIHQVYHMMVPRTVDEYYQEIGRAGRDGKPALAKIFFNGSDIASNKEGMTDPMRQYCLNDTTCLRQCLLNYFNAKPIWSSLAKHQCCSVCERNCSCDSCLKGASGG